MNQLPPVRLAIENPVPNPPELAETGTVIFCSVINPL